MPNPNRQPNNNNWRNNTTVTSYTDTKSNKPKETASKPKRQSFRNAVKNWFASKTKPVERPVDRRAKTPIKKPKPEASNTFNNTPIFKTPGTAPAQQIAKSKFVQSVKKLLDSSNGPHGGQFGGVTQQARDIYRANTAFNKDDLNSWANAGRRRAKAESTTSFGDQQYYLVNSLEDNAHRRIVKQGERWIGGESVANYLHMGLDLESPDTEFTEDEINEIQRRYGEYEDYMERYYIKRPFYNSETNRFEEHYCIASWAPLPPWVKRTAKNLKEWSYYTGFMAQTGDDLRDKATALYEQREKYKDTPYKSAFNLAGDPELENQVNSLADVVYSTIGSGEKGWGKVNYFLDAYNQYRKEYTTNVVKAGKFDTLIGNRLWALMDDMDFAARGVRAFFSAGGWGESGSTGFANTKSHYIQLEGQTASDSKLAQDVFMAHGGMDLGNQVMDENWNVRSLNAEERAVIIAELEDAFDSQYFKDKGITWKSVYDQMYNSKTGQVKTNWTLDEAVDNVKKAYTDPESAFNADTGNFAMDMLLETITDPGLVIGGLSKGIAKTGAKETSEIAIRDVLKAVTKASDREVTDILTNKKVQKAIRSFSRVDEGRAVLFRNKDSILNEAKALAGVLSAQGVLDNTAKLQFRLGLTNALTGTKHMLNGQIIGEQTFKQIKNSRKLAKMASYVDRGIDAIDMAIIKGTFIEPVALGRVFKEGRDLALSEGVLGNIVAVAKRNKDEVSQAIYNSKRANGVFGMLDELQENLTINKLRDEDIADEVKAIKSQFSTASRQFEDLIIKLPDASPEQILREADEILASISGAGDNALKDIDALLQAVRSNYSFGGDLDDVLSSLKRSYSDLVEAMQRQDNLLKKDFFKEVRSVRSSDELATIINKYSDKFNMWDVKTSILDNIINKKLIPEEQLDEILAQLDNGLLSERVATSFQVEVAAARIKNTVTTVEKRIADGAIIKNVVEHLPNLQVALKDAERYPFLKKLNAVLVKASDGRKYSEKQILYHISEAQLGLAEASKLSMVPVSVNEAKVLNDELINLKRAVEKQIEFVGNEVISEMHLDRQVKFDSIMRDSKFSKVFDVLYESGFKGAVDLLNNKIMQGTDAFGNSKIYQSLSKLGDIKYTYNRYRRFLTEIDSLPVDDKVKYAIRNGVFGTFGESGKNLTEATRKPGKVRTWLNAMLYNEFSSSKVGMESLTARLNTLDNYEPDELIAGYVDQIKSNPTINDWYRGLMNGDPADPQVYLEKQILATIFMDPDSVARFNSHEGPLIFTHISTTGLSDDAAITGISYFKWKKLEVGDDGKPTMEAIYNMLHSDNGVDTLKYWSPSVILDENFLRSIYKGSIGERSLSFSELSANYFKVFGAGDNSINGERDLMEEFFTRIYPDTIGKGRNAGTVVPTLVVHDLDGFNIPFINRRAGLYADESLNPRTWDYYNRLSSRTQNCSINTFEEMRSMVNDHMLTDEEFKQVEESLSRFAEDLSMNTGKDFNMLDIQDVPYEMRSILDELDKTSIFSEDDDIIQLLRQSLNFDEASKMLDDAESVIDDVALLDDEARQIVAVRYPHSKPVKSKLHDPSIEHTPELKEALARLGERLGVDIYIDAFEQFEFADNAVGFLAHYDRPSSVTLPLLAVDTTRIHDMKQTFVHELRHHLSLTDDNGGSFKQLLINRYDAATPEVQKEFRQFWNYLCNLYDMPFSDRSNQTMMEEVSSSVFEGYFSDPKIILDLQDAMRSRGVLDTVEGLDAFNTFSDLYTVLRSDFNLKATVQAPDAYFDGAKWAASTIVDKLISKDEMYDEFINSMVDTILSKERLDKLTRKVFTQSNPVRDAAEVTGRRVLNVADRYELRSVTKYFSLGNIDNGIKETFHNINKMSTLTKYVEEKLRYSTRIGAEDYLTPVKGKLDDTIEAVRNLAVSSPNTDGYFSWLRGLKIPDTATESYLICQKLYDDLLKYWLNDDLVRDFSRYSDVGLVSDKLGKGGVRERLLAEFVDNLNFSGLRSDVDNFDEILDLFEGNGQSFIFKDVPVEYVSKFDMYTSHGKLKDGVDMANRLKRAYNQMRQVADEERYLDNILRASGIETKADYALGMMYTHTAELMDLANKIDLDNPVIRNAISSISDAHVMRFQDARYKRLLTDGKIDTNKLMSELLYNGSNHVLFPKQYLNIDDWDEIRRAVKELNDNGMDYIKVAEDRGAISIYFTDKCEVIKIMENGQEQRFIHKISDNTYGGRYIKPELDDIPLPTPEELKAFGIDEGLDDSFWEFYSKLRECWADVGTLTEGASNGTLGRVVFDQDADEYYKLANNFMPDLLSSKGARDARMYGRTTYDPGFMLTGDFDILSDYMHTMEVQAENFKASGVLMNNVFGSGNEFNFGHLAELFTDAELMEQFGDNSDFVVCALVPGKGTKTGLQVKQLNMSTKGDVAAARGLGNTAVLPYDVYLDMVDSINVPAYTSDLNRAINKMMLVYKAGALFHPGTWVRNFIDATQKATTDLGQSPTGIFDTFFSELKGIRDITKYHQALKYGEDFLNEANWKAIQQALNTDMTFEQFNLLRGMFDSDRYVSKAQTMLGRKRALRGGTEVISGDRVGLNNLDERDITKCYNMASRKNNLMDKRRFIEIYTGVSEAADSSEAKLYEESLRTISDYMHSSSAITSFSNAVSATFIPFNAVETTVRYTQLSRLNDLGFSNNQALKRVHLTQFRQAERMGIPNKLEYIVPFITFKYNNLKYWMRMMDENPRYFRYFEKLYGNIYEDTVEQYVEKGEQLDFESNWMLKSGGIPIGNGNYYFKINPSFLDALNTIYGFPTEAISSQNPLLRLATRASMYQLGLDGKYIFQELNLNPDDINVDLRDIVSTVAPRASQLAELRNFDLTKLRTWADDLGPDMPTLHKLIPSLIGKNSRDYGGGEFKDYLDALAKDGLWYDANTGQIVDIKYKNETGMNSPDVPWMDLNNYMMQHFNNTWDSNLGKFVKFWELTEGGLNQVFDFDRDPDAWDKLCAEWEKKGKKYDYNQRKFIPISEWRPDGLNNPNLTFDEKVELMAEKFPDLKWDANQNTFVTADNYISGGLNNVSEGFQGFREVCVYRYLLFGEEYDKATKKFNKTSDAKIVKFDKLHSMDRYKKYYAMLGIPSLADTYSKISVNSEGFLVDAEGRYVLFDNPAYNQKVFNKLAKDYEYIIPTWGRRGRRYGGWKRYSYNKYKQYNQFTKIKGSKKRNSAFYQPKTYQTGYGWNAEEGYYRLEYQYRYQYNNPQPRSKLNRLISPPIIYPYGGGYNKFSFHNRF